jgi:hypothetical protein
MADDARIVDFDAARPRVLDGQPGAAGDHAGNRLAGAGDRIGDGFEDERLVGRFENKCFQRGTSL